MKRYSINLASILWDHYDLVLAAFKLGGAENIVITGGDPDRSILVEYDSIGPDTEINIMREIQPLFGPFYRERTLDDYPVGETWMINGQDWRIIHAFKTGPMENPHVAVVLTDGIIDTVMHLDNRGWFLAGTFLRYKRVDSGLELIEE